MPRTFTDKEMHNILKLLDDLQAKIHALLEEPKATKIEESEQTSDSSSHKE